MASVCTLCSGTAFGECVLNDGFHSVSVISNESCTLLRVPKADFQDIWQKSSHFMEEIVTPPFSLSSIEKSKRENSPPSENESVAVVDKSATPAAPPTKQVGPEALTTEVLEPIDLPDNVSYFDYVIF